MASGKTWRLAIAGGAALLLVAIPAQAQSVLNRGGGAEPESLDLLLTGSPGNYASYRNPKFDAAMAAAEREPDAQRRAALLQKAENLALADLPWLPIRFLSQSGPASRRLYPE